MSDTKTPGYVYTAAQQPPPPYPGPPVPDPAYGSTGYPQGAPGSPQGAGYAQPPGYYQGTGYSQPQPVTTQPVHQTVLIHEYEPRPPNYMWLSCVVYFCCNILFGAIAFAFALSSSSAADEGDMKQARKLSVYSLYMSITGIIVTCIIAFILIVFNFSVGFQHKYNP